jgi:hypothetical protein
MPARRTIKAGSMKSRTSKLLNKGTRIVVFGDTPEKARRVAEEITHKAFWNSSYFGGTYEELRRAGLWQERIGK